MSVNPVEVTFSDSELIVSKTDLRGNITYANRHFMRIANFNESELLGHPHNIIRHPDMPRGVYYAMWKTIKAKNEFFGFVKNLTAEGNFYWVFANITPDKVEDKIQGFFSVRRNPPRSALPVIEAVYAEMRSIEARNSKESAPQKSWEWLLNKLATEHGTSYEEFALNLYNNG